MLSFLAGIGGTYIYWTVFPTNDPLTLKQSEGERRVAEMVDQIDCARIDLALDSIKARLIWIVSEIYNFVLDYADKSFKGIFIDHDAMIASS